MTLKNSFSKALKEDRKRRIWPFVLFCLICFMMTAAFELNLENYISSELAYARIQQNIEHMTQSGMIVSYLLMAGAAACLYGFQGFGWLTKREQVDFYHSQPMKREKRFFMIYLNGILMCFFPMLLHVGIYTLLIGIRGYLNGVIIGNICLNTLIFIIAFLVIYHLVIFAVMLTGNIIVSIMISGIMFLYATVVKFLVEGFIDTYFLTYANGYSDTTGWMGYLSPAEQLYKAANYMVRGTTSNLMIHLAVLVLMMMAMFGAAFFLYKRRKSEAAGSALAYPLAGDIIRFLIVIPCGMLFGLVFTSFGSMAELFWLFFGTILGVILGHGFMEVIFQFDIKAALKKKGQLGIGLVLGLTIVNIFYFDLLGYDTYIPKEEQIEEAAYYINLGEDYGSYRSLNAQGIPVATLKEYYEEGNSVDFYTYRDEWQLEKSLTNDVEPILQLVKAHMSSEEDTNQSEDNFQCNMIVWYKMKNGREIYRSYTVSGDVIREFYQPIFETAQGKSVVYPYLTLTGKQAKSVNITTAFMSGSKNLELTEAQIMELVECYKADIKELTLDELLSINYVGQAVLLYERPENAASISEFELPLMIAEQYEHTLAYLEEKGVSMTLPNDGYIVRGAVVYNPYSIDETVNHPYWQGRESVILTREEIDSLVPVMVPEEFSYHAYNTEYILNVSLSVTNKTTLTQRSAYYIIPLEYTPEYMLLEAAKE